MYRYPLLVFRRRHRQKFRGKLYVSKHTGGGGGGGGGKQYTLYYIYTD